MFNSKCLTVECGKLLVLVPENTGSNSSRDSLFSPEENQARHGETNDIFDQLHNQHRSKNLGQVSVVLFVCLLC